MLTHDEIAAMTCEQVNKEIAIRLCQYYETPKPHGIISDYCHDWSHAGRLLEMMAVDCVAVQVIYISASGNWTARYEKTPKTDGDICFTAPTPIEAIVRCWLEWWEVTHE